MTDSEAGFKLSRIQLFLVCLVFSSKSVVFMYILEFLLDWTLNNLIQKRNYSVVGVHTHQFSTIQSVVFNQSLRAR